MPSFKFVGSDPIDHFALGRIEPGDVVEFDEDPGGEWEASRRKPQHSAADAEKTLAHGRPDLGDQSNSTSGPGNAGPGNAGPVDPEEG